METNNNISTISDAELQNITGGMTVFGWTKEDWDNYYKNWGDNWKWIIA